MTIKFKFPLRIFIIFTVSFLMLIFVVNSRLERSNEATITREMKTLKK
ncbi:hypothetical protein BD780_002568 [Clostridium tetanomorphum]|nr:hypothetical protein [Clostridium tetanomorphum]NRS85343.1 hypothetical protein [Clostridium tetanomorphum]SQC02939.1 Uncharacterised protein [Clostridium tetanomorphum]